MCQAWIEESQSADAVDVCAPAELQPGWIVVMNAEDQEGNPLLLVHADRDDLHRVAAFDALINNADRKGGHVIVDNDDRIWCIDHGVSFNADDKLRTVLWGWAGDPIDDDTVDSLRALKNRLGRKLGSRLRSHITAAEVDALCRRVRALVADPVMPSPSGRRPLPWPAF
jgi:uncharacterized repeat protein (TIGR03843 family)